MKYFLIQNWNEVPVYVNIILVCSHKGATFFGPKPPAPSTFLRPPAQITCSRPRTMELLFHGTPASKITFSWSPVTKVRHVFFTPLNKTQPTACLKIPLAKRSYHT